MKKSTIQVMQENLQNANLRDSGGEGKAFEIAIRYYVSNRLPKKVKSQGKIDLYTKKLSGKTATVEIKTACGEVEMAEKSQFIIYAPVVDTTFPAEFQGYVFTREEWKAFINGYTGRGAFLREDKKRGHLHIQSFYVSETIRPKASKPIANYIWDVCNNQPTVSDFFE